VNCWGSGVKTAALFLYGPAPVKIAKKVEIPLDFFFGLSYNN